MSRSGRLWFIATCLVVFAVAAVWVSWSTPSVGPSGKTPATVTLAPGTTRPAGLAVADLSSIDRLRQRFNYDQDTPRLVLAPT